MYLNEYTWKGSRQQEATSPASKAASTRSWGAPGAAEAAAEAGRSGSTTSAVTRATPLSRKRWRREASCHRARRITRRFRSPLTRRASMATRKVGQKAVSTAPGGWAKSGLTGKRNLLDCCSSTDSRGEEEEEEEEEEEGEEEGEEEEEEEDIK